VHLTPEGVLRLELPVRTFRFLTRIGRRVDEHAGHLATVVIEPVAMRVLVVWQTALQVVGREVEQLDVTRIVER
jgi:hypothetical protein